MNCWPHMKSDISRSTIHWWRALTGPPFALFWASIHSLGRPWWFYYDFLMSQFLRCFFLPCIVCPQRKQWNSLNLKDLLFSEAENILYIKKKKELGWMCFVLFCPYLKHLCPPPFPTVNTNSSRSSPSGLFTSIMLQIQSFSGESLLPVESVYIHVYPAFISSVIIFSMIIILWLKQ